MRQGYADQSRCPYLIPPQCCWATTSCFTKSASWGWIVLAMQSADFGISTRLLSAQSGQEYGSYSLGKIFYAQKHRVGLQGNLLPRSRPQVRSWQANSVLRFGSRWQLESQQIWHDETSRWQELGAALYYRADQRRLFSVGARKRLESSRIPGRSAGASRVLRYLARI